jgi:hypothetical protein
VPNIPPNLLDCAIYLYETAEDAREGKSVGGTGFLVGYITERERLKHVQLYAVTNAHVVDIHLGNSPVIRLNTHLGATDVLDIPHDSWIAHPDRDDIAICPLKLTMSIQKYRWLPLDMFLEKDRMRGINPGAECFLVGRFLTHEGKQRNAPTVRSGVLAQLPEDPIRNDDTGLSQESFLVEIKSIGGYSGSPVFVLGNVIRLAQSAGVIQNQQRQEMQQQFYFLGVNWCHTNTWEQVYERSRGTYVPTQSPFYVKSNTGMAGVVPAWKLREMFELQEVTMAREMAIKQDVDEHGGAELDVAREVMEKGPYFTREVFEQALAKATRKVKSK